MGPKDVVDPSTVATVWTDRSALAVTPPYVRLCATERWDETSGNVLWMIGAFSRPWRHLWLCLGVAGDKTVFSLGATGQRREPVAAPADLASIQGALVRGCHYSSGPECRSYGGDMWGADLICWPW